MKSKNLLTPADVARQLGVSRSTIYRWFWEGKLRGVRFSKSNIRIIAGSVEALIADCW